MHALDDDFLFGSATSSHQVEGDNRNNDWWDWEQDRSHIVGGEGSGAAAEWWAGRAEEDLRAAAELGQNAHRMSVEWSRLEPEPGRFDEAAFERYREILRAGRELGLSMLVTLHHFTLPRWVAKRGGWSDPGIVYSFARYASEAGRQLHSHVDLFATMNEPSVLAWGGYSGTRWPPGLGRLPASFIALSHMLEAHARAYRAVRRAAPGAKVGLVLNLPWFVPADPRRRRDRLAAAAQDWAFNGAVLSALSDGRLRFPLSVTGRRHPTLARSLDWVGLNFYGRYDVRFDPTATDAAFGRHVQSPTIRNEHTDWGQPSPEGMLAQLRRLSSFGVPLYVTENGIYDNEDTRRAAFIADHVRALMKARDEGLDVRGYFVWSLVDNFEWAEGWTTRFGLLALDRETQKRTPRPSAEAYAKICRARGVPD